MLTIGLFALLFLLSPFNVKVHKDNSSSNEEFSRAIVKEILPSNSTDYQKIKVLIKEGKLKGKEFTVDNNLSRGDNLLLLKPKDTILLMIRSSNENNFDITVYEYIRERKLLYLVCSFALLILVIGGIKGLQALVSVTFTICVISILFIPGLLSGYNPIKLSIICSLIISFFSLIVQNGLNKKSFSSLIGTVGGITVAALVTYLMGNSLNISMNSEEIVQLSRLSENINFNFQSIFFSSVVIGALGANIDMSMSVASAMNEIKESNKNITNLEFIKCGMNVGRDVIGTMCNTLILAYVGSSLVTLMIFVAYNINFTYIANLQEISIEILRSLAGSMGIILSVPLTVISRVLMD
ncbi:putative membrane protein [Clostridium tetanomorphum]|uniref:YibE/F family protein n=2 Tax=Clostridium tetanomorphum TaxID=1553 RepID=A0A923EC97_CLOTT|nr:YibE/F family protein [Clostridium tetanomorphum]MBC2398656.1 YibE/F family protein [Clostridium tetanomorphum]MBP1864065.1 putative membrane protein [Clostridium tetanomorphum]NRS84478.1 putative membrane protein [Clostridium tetanomorphum]